MSFKNKMHQPDSPTRRDNHVILAMLVSLCLGGLVAGVMVLSYKANKTANNAHEPLDQNLRVPESSTNREAAPPAFQPPGTRAPSDSRQQVQRTGRASGTTSVDQRSVNRINARLKMLESAPLRKTAGRSEAQPARVNLNREPLTLDVPMGKPDSNLDLAAASRGNPVSEQRMEAEFSVPNSQREVGDANKDADKKISAGSEKPDAMPGSGLSRKATQLTEALTVTRTGPTTTSSSKTIDSTEKEELPQVQINLERANMAPELSQVVSSPPAEFRGDLRDLPQAITEGERKLFSPPKELDEGLVPKAKEPLPGVQPQPPSQPEAPLAPMPNPITTFKGLDFLNNGAGWPPDTVGDVGPNHYIQAVNTSVGIFNKSTGAKITSVTFGQLWSAAGGGTGTPCDTTHQGDPTVIYDPLADRWIVADFSWSNLMNGPYYECIAVSKTSDPVSGGWWLYGIRADDDTHRWLPDYPKMGIWPDGLYMGTNMFDCLNPGCSSASYQGARAYAFNLSDLRSGVPVRTVIADLGTSRFTVIPSNLRGTAPPAGRENLFVGESISVFGWEVFKFHVVYDGPGSTFTGPTVVSQTSYPLTNPTITTPGGSLDTLLDRMMMQVQYRNISGVESLWVNHTVPTPSDSAITGIQWGQINVTGGTIVTTPVQQQIYGNLGSDGLHRWMGSLAVDKDGNMALGYSVANATTNPDIRYAGRLATDVLNSLPQTETTMLPLVTRNSQSTFTNRWGDYSAMTVDPDGCTFWYTQEYYESLGTNWQTRIGSFKFPSCSTPTAAKVKTFTADAFDDGRVLLSWSSSHEVDNLGYNVYRETQGRRVKINPQTIAGSALVTGPGVALSAGQSYAWGDQLTEAGTRYWLEDVDLSGKSSWTGPITLNPTGGKAPRTAESAILTSVGLASAQMTLGQGSTTVDRTAEYPRLTPATIKLQSELAGRPAVKLGVSQEGWYRISQQDLVDAGLSPGVNARNLQLYVDGRQVPIIVNGEQDGKLDPSDSVEFYGVGLNSAATSTHVYWLVAGGQTGARIKSTKTAGNQSGSGSFVTAVERRDRTLYFAGLRNGETENFFGPVVAGTSVDQSLTLTNVAPTSTPATLEVYVQGVTLTPHQTEVKFNGAVVGSVNFKGQERGRASFQIAPSQLREGVNSVELISQGGPSDISLVDTVRVSYEHTFTADSDRLSAKVKGGQAVTIGGFSSSDIRVIDVTDASDPQELIGTITSSKGKLGVTVRAPGSGTRALLAFTDSRAISAPAKANLPSNWRGAGLQYDYVMVTTGEIKGSLEPLKALRESQGLSVAVVDVEDIYDEFSFGNKSPQAIRDFLQFTRDNWRRLPRFVLFAGDSSYDPKNYLGYGDSDLVPTKLYDSAYMEAASDDWFVDFRGTGLPEIATGRLPVRNVTEAAALVAKIISYENSSGANSALLTADLNDGHNFAVVGDALRSLLPGDMRVQEVVRDANDPGVKSELLAAINQGQTIVNYNGHGSSNQWRGGLLTNADTASLTNRDRLSLFVIMTCLNGYFDDPVLDSLAESLLKASGGAAAVWASGAQTEAAPQEALNEELYRLLFSGDSLTVGEAAARAKQAVVNADVRRSWILFGDPAMKLK